MISLLTCYSALNICIMLHAIIYSSLPVHNHFICDRTETEYVSQMLTKVKRFAQHHSCHVWFVAHPRQVGYHDLLFVPKSLTF